MPLSFPPVDLKPVLELRERLERRSDADFDRRTPDGTADLLGRYRVGLSYRASRVTGQLVYQYAHDLRWRTSRNSSVERSDLLLGFAKTSLGRGDLTVGRQRLAIGSQRILGERNWNNVSNAFDAVRYSVGDLDLFAGKPGVLPTPLNRASLAGADLTSRYGTTLFLARGDDQAIGETSLYTLDHHARQNWGRVGGMVELAGQLGARRGKRVEAWAGIARLAYNPTQKVSVFVEGAIASGGGNGKVSRTFDNLYGSRHDQHGLLDLLSWQNMRRLSLEAVYEPTRSVSIKFEAHRFGLYSASDAWYGANGAPNQSPQGLFYDPTGSRGQDIGAEYDLDTAWQLGRGVTLLAGGGVFQPGRYVRAFSGGEDRPQWFGYVQYQYRF